MIYLRTEALDVIASLSDDCSSRLAAYEKTHLEFTLGEGISVSVPRQILKILTYIQNLIRFSLPLFLRNSLIH